MGQGWFVAMDHVSVCNMAESAAQMFKKLYISGVMFVKTIGKYNMFNIWLLGKGNVFGRSC